MDQLNVNTGNIVKDLDLSNVTKCTLFIQVIVISSIISHQSHDCHLISGTEDETQWCDEVKSNKKPEKVQIRSVDTGLTTKVRWFLHKCE